MRPHLRSLAAAAALSAGPAQAAAPRMAVVTLDAPPDLQFTGKSVAEAFAHEAAGRGDRQVAAARGVSRPARDEPFEMVDAIDRIS